MASSVVAIVPAETTPSWAGLMYTNRSSPFRKPISARWALLPVADAMLVIVSGNGVRGSSVTIFFLFLFQPWR